MEKTKPGPWSPFCNFFTGACVYRKLASWIKTTFVLFAHCPSISGPASDQRPHLLWRQGGSREPKSLGCEVHCLGSNSGTITN